MSVVDGSFDNLLSLEERASMPLAGGIEQMGFQCGQIWGAALAAGARAYQLYGPGSKAEAAAVVASQRLVESFRDSYKSINCADVIQMDWKKPERKQILQFFLRGGPIRCFSMTAGYARATFNEINTAFSDNHLVLSSDVLPPVSCSSVLAHQMGASEMHAVMAAGLAGGIGLSGGACGALGAAIWIHAMNSGRDGKIEFNSPEAMAAIDRFVESTDVRFECSEIIGRKFHNVSEHAEYVRTGGCSKIIQALTNL